MSFVTAFITAFATLGAALLLTNTAALWIYKRTNWAVGVCFLAPVVVEAAALTIYYQLWGIS